MVRHGIAIGVVSLVLVGCTPSGPPAPPGPVPPPVPPGDVARLLLDACNEYRASRGLPSLALDPRLQASAGGHSQRMASVGKMAHVGIGDGDPFGRIQSAGYAYRTAGECVAWGQLDAGSVLRAWESDPPHRAILEGPYVDCGGAGVRGRDGGIYWCMDFGAPAR